jgi:tetratricopeptide (TPR) repeat protein/DNA-binding CsgD family transcriptional regulator
VDERARRLTWATAVSTQPALAPILQPFSPLALEVHRITGAVVGRPVELAAIRQELDAARSGRLSAVTVEGEPGIGKTRLLLAASEVASAQGFTVVAVAADEEIRGPFLLARSIVGAPEANSAAAGSAALEPLQRSVRALSGQDEPGLDSLPPDQKLLRTLDLAAMGLRDLAAVRPMALLIDDLQWADDDSLRLLRYVVRASAGSPIFLMLAIRPEELAFVNEAVNLVADMERLGLVRRMKVNRFTQVETAEFLRQVLGGRIDPAGAAAMHAQAEGVPFIVEELARAYRDAGMVQEIDGNWTLARNAERLVPSAVRTLISRRAARVPDETKEALAEAAVLGRHFSLKDLQALQVELGEAESSSESLDEALAPAVRAGLLVQHAADSPADYSFAHDQVRELATTGLTPARRRAIHQAILNLLMVGEPAPESLPLLAYHAKAAGDATVCVRFSLQAIHNALAASAPEEVLRVVDMALPTAAAPQDRVKLLRARDQALDMLRRSADRLEGLAELAALAEALGDSALETEVQLRRAAAFRLSGEFDQAADLARRVRERAAEKGDGTAELASCIELGQDLLRMDLGDGYSLATPEEFDSTGAEEAYERAAQLAEELGDRASLAASLRELGVIDFSKVRAYFIDQYKAGKQHEILQRVTGGETLPQILGDTPVAPLAGRSTARFERALELYEALGDRRGVMSAIIAMAYSTWGPDIHFGRGAGHHIEEIRRLASRWDTMTRESERALAEAQMLYGAHVFSRAKVVPDMAVSRGQEAHRKARVMGDRALEFLAAGGTALANLDLGDVDEAKSWLDRAASAAAESPTSFRARMLETWRGLWRGAMGDAEEMRAHLDRAVQMAAEQGRPAARCEALALLAVEAARLGAERKEEELMSVAEKAAIEVKGLMELLPGHPPWGAQADSALARVALARGAVDDAVEAARSAYRALESAGHEDAHLEVLIPVADAFVAGGTDEERQMAQGYLRVTLALSVQRTADEDVRVRWLRGPVGRELVRLAGPMDGRDAGLGDGEAIEEEDAALLGLLVEGLTNREIAGRLEVDEEVVARRLGETLARIGASSRAEATAFALREVV